MVFLRSLLQCACPPAAALTAIPANTCLERFGQIQKIMIQRTKDGATTNIITIASTNPNVLATWTALKAAVANTKVVVTPYIENPENTPGDPRTYGGGNATLGGIEKTIGSNPSPFTAEFHDITQAIIAVIKEIQCETDISIFLINEHGEIIGITDDPATPTTFKGIQARSFFVSDKKLGMFEEVDKNIISWAFLPNWSDLLYRVTPTDFDALIDL